MIFKVSQFIYVADQAALKRRELYLVKRVNEKTYDV